VKSYFSETLNTLPMILRRLETLLSLK